MRPGVLSGIDFRSVRPAYAELPVIRPGSKSAARRYKGPVSRASLLDDQAVARAVDCIVSHSRSPESDHLKLLLSYRGGLRAGEKIVTKGAFVAKSQAMKSQLGDND